MSLNQSINQEKFSTLNKVRKETHRQVNSMISQLNAAVDSAMKQQAYMHKNPDNNGANELIAVVTPEFLSTAAAFNEIAAKLTDMQAVQSGAMTADDNITKYSIDLTGFSNELI